MISKSLATHTHTHFFLPETRCASQRSLTVGAGGGRKGPEKLRQQACPGYSEHKAQLGGACTLPTVDMRHRLNATWPSGRGRKRERARPRARTRSGTRGAKAKKGRRAERGSQEPEKKAGREAEQPDEQRPGTRRRAEGEERGTGTGNRAADASRARASGSSEFGDGHQPLP